ncbi:hypothetical protein [Streptomyces sp. NPDC048340]|uniref:hypothetical protein n=1 Tax=Streptomyces sp. NPDC048340 TaxID=3365537 RepID=UPI003717C497
MTSPAEPGGEFRPTHVVPQEGLPAWEAPDVSRPTASLDAFLPVRLLSRRGEWGEVLCSNGWSAWVDGRLLVAVPQPPPTGGRPLARTEDPQPLLAHTAEALERYRRAVREYASGGVDSGAFRRGTRGLRAGVVVDGESVWLYDETAGRWMYADGTRLTTYAVVSGPGARAAPEAPPQDTDPAGAADVQEADTGAVAGPGADVDADAGSGSGVGTGGTHEPTRIADLPGAGPGAGER